jgi:hypothetical protein
MTFGEFSPKWRCPANRPKHPSPRNRTVGMWVVGIAFAVLLLLLLVNGCPSVLQPT